jgi:poly(A) polymerase
MIKKFIDKLLGKPAAAAAKKANPLGKRVEVEADVHGINPDLLDERAVKVVKTLTDAGFEAYIVGGAVRDLLLGMRPKDFDVATNATPEQVKGLFRRAFIIGRLPHRPRRLRPGPGARGHRGLDLPRAADRV